jgi:hypothetical protein
VELNSVLKRFLNNSTTEGVDINLLLQEMLNQIGSIDSELRDNLIYSAFGKLILENYLSENQMKHILESCLDEHHLFFQIGNCNTDSVFTRSFSSLVIALILHRDHTNSFLTETQAKKAINSIILYLEQERDKRGFVEGKGWAHSVAHGADALTEAVKHPHFDSSLSKNCLNSIKASILSDTVFIDDEDERLIFAIEALIEKGLADECLLEWVHSFIEELDGIKPEEGFSLSFFRTNTNVMNLFKSLYFRLLYKGLAVKTRKAIEEMIERKFVEFYNEG